jgi:hypothetical protein
MPGGAHLVAGVKRERVDTVAPMSTPERNWEGMPKKEGRGWRMYVLVPAASGR